MKTTQEKTKIGLEIVIGGWGVRDRGVVSAETLLAMRDELLDEVASMTDSYDRDLTLLVAALLERGAECGSSEQIDELTRRYASAVSWDREYGQLSVALSYPEMMGILVKALGGLENAIHACVRTSLKHGCDELRLGIRRAFLGEYDVSEMNGVYDPLLEVFLDDESASRDVLAERLVSVCGLVDQASETWMHGVDPRAVARGAGMEGHAADLFSLLSRDAHSGAKTMREAVEAIVSDV